MQLCGMAPLQKKIIKSKDKQGAAGEITVCACCQTVTSVERGRRVMQWFGT